MTTVIESAFAGDSHGMIMADAGEKAGISFRKTITAAAANFMGASLIGQDDGRIEFQMDDFRKDAEFFGQEKTERFARKAARLGVLFDQAVQQELPFFSNIGMTAIHFVRDMTAAAQANGEDAALMSAKMARFAA